jgi:hypothetical protein
MPDACTTVDMLAGGRKGSLEFQHTPRFYFNFALD